MLLLRKTLSLCVFIGSLNMGPRGPMGHMGPRGPTWPLLIQDLVQYFCERTRVSNLKYRSKTTIAYNSTPLAPCSMIVLCSKTRHQCSTPHQFHLRKLQLRLQPMSPPFLAPWAAALKPSYCRLALRAPPLWYNTPCLRSTLSKTFFNDGC